MVISGYEMCEDDIIAIARLRGSQLSTFDVPWCCVSQAFDYEDEFPVHPPAYGQVSTGFIEEVTSLLMAFLILTCIEVIVKPDN